MFFGNIGLSSNVICCMFAQFSYAPYDGTYRSATTTLVQLWYKINPNFYGGSLNQPMKESNRINPFVKGWKTPFKFKKSETREKNIFLQRPKVVPDR